MLSFTNAGKPKTDMKKISKDKGKAIHVTGREGS
jgi:hypothetical protein